jgi:two-component system NtrC family sensor kinase
MSQPETTEERQRAVESINHEARRASKIVRNLLTFARRHQPERQATDLNQIVTDTVELRRYALRVARVELVLDLDESLPLTWADPFQLQQVVLNLLTNAEQAMEGWNGARKISFETRQRGDTLVLSVRDSGPGIDERSIDKLFTPFYTTKAVGKGTGLGLSISEGIVREHAGEITVTSTPGAGATFTVELPRVAPPTVEEGATDASSADAARKWRILVADDESSVREALQLFLRSLGHKVDVAGSGMEAVSRLESHQYDAILLDLRMPDVAGDVVYRKLLARDPQLATRVIFVTGDAHSGALGDFVAGSGRPYISKPFVLEDVARLISEAAA